MSGRKNKPAKAICALDAECFHLFDEACAAFERGDKEGHASLRLAHKEATERRRLLVEREGKSVH